MTLRQVRKLRNGDEVFWNDPDEGKCSKTITIQTIEIHGEVIRITGNDTQGYTELECFPRELS